MDKEQLEKIKMLFTQYPEIKLGYFFGSRANESANPMSDYDFGLQLGEDANPISIKSELQVRLTLILKTDKVDVVVMNNPQNPLLAYNIITTGKLIYEIEPYKILTEPKILNMYFDFMLEKRKNGLIGAKR